MTRALLSSNGDFFGTNRSDLEPFDFVIAVDGGIRHLEKLGIQPDLWVGDMDSSKALGISEDFIKGVNMERLSEKKDMSDTDYAVSRALELGAGEITLIGGIGSRLDHSLFNLNLMFSLTRDGIPCKILDGRQEILFFCIEEGDDSGSEAQVFEIDSGLGTTFSIVPFSDIKGLSAEGVEYPLSKKDLSRYSNLTLSNVITSERASISAESGMFLIIFSQGY
ncbi:MAG: thiamine diphosphokinase [Bacillota bacterium]|nr:thiamine diphosphokinase [Bacillota bacterium]